jgi:Abi-like protein
MAQLQELNCPPDNEFQAIETALSADRIGRYLGPASLDRKLAFRYYLWNCELCEAFYFPFHIAEVVCRNAISSALIFHYGNNWFESQPLKNSMRADYSRDLEAAVAEERAQHDAAMTSHHVTSALSFGFWDHLTTQRFEMLLWKRGITHNFRSSPLGTKLSELNLLIQSIRNFRNRIAHHKAIFDKAPASTHADALKLIGWVCPTTQSWVAANSRVVTLLAQRPQQIAAGQAVDSLVEGTPVNDAPEEALSRPKLNPATGRKIISLKHHP